MSAAPDTAAIRARCEAASPGPWDVDGRVRCIAIVAPAGVDSPGLGSDYPGVIAFWSGPSSTPDPSGPWADARRERIAADADFIAHAREDVPALLTALEAAQADAARLRERVAELEAALANERGEGAPPCGDWFWTHNAWNARGPRGGLVTRNNPTWDADACRWRPNTWTLSIFGVEETEHPTARAAMAAALTPRSDP